MKYRHQRNLSWRGFIILTGFMTFAWTPGIAQDFSAPIESSFANMSSFAGTTAVNSAIAASARYAASQGGRPETSAPAPRATTLSFHSSAAVTAQTNVRILAALRTNSPEAATDGFRKALESGQIHAAFARLLQSAGFSATDLADVLMGYMVISWEVVNADDSRRHAAGYAVVRDRLRQSLLADPLVSRMSDADRQQFAETLEVLAILAAATRDGLKQSGQTDKLRALQAGVRHAGRNLGIDLGRLAFTDNGFVAR